MVDKRYLKNNSAFSDNYLFILQLMYRDEKYIVYSIGKNCKSERAAKSILQLCEQIKSAGDLTQFTD